MDDNHSILNNYLVDFFHHILKIERNALNTLCDELSIREIHTIEAIVNSDDHRVGSIAAQLKITMGTLSVALKTLESKGYVIREKMETDRRQVQVIVTEKGIEINRRHQDFHQKMIQEVTSCLSDKELNMLMIGLDRLNEHFHALDCISH